MYEEIDLRPYINMLLRKWYWIAGAAVIAALAAYVISSTLPPTFEATAIVAITEPRQLVQFDPRFQTLEEEQPLRAYPELATSDEILQTLLQRSDLNFADAETVQGVRRMLEAESGSDPTLVRLSARHGNAEEAAQIVNEWARLFVDWTNDIYQGNNGEQLTFFEVQLARADADLEAAEEALIAYQARNRGMMLDNALRALQETQSAYLAEKRTVDSLIEDASALRDQLAAQDLNREASLGDLLTALALQLRAYNSVYSSPETQSLQAPLPLQLQVNGADSLTATSRAEQSDAVEALLVTLETRASQSDERISALEPEILDVQQRKQEALTEEARLMRDRDVANETYIALARKVDEERITSADESGRVQLASRASVPQNGSGLGRLTAAAAGALIGLATGSVGVLIVGRLRTETYPPVETTGSMENLGQH